MFTNTGAIYLVYLGDRAIDIGNYYTSPEGERVVITTKGNAKKYAHLVDCPVYVKKESEA